VLVAGTVGSSGNASCAAGTITVGRDGADPKWLLAHELGHHVTGHCGQGIQNEIAANGGAIRILQVWGETEQEAVGHTQRHLVRLQQRGRTLVGHDYCAEYAAIVTAYAQYTPEDPGPCR